ncbi:A/G-specific adenine glycosylase [Halomonas sp. PGE1]|uniref:A/G-specific adenine glycosylase n=1 Tax=Halomonas sp. PGE1 TaxID=2730360 RepID=UPI0014741855|nr:A/G-specific adenine glycosylase [Halomonas sp. PGE1]QJQ97747.1 A/G-specific adenine glycosylase [Halomonas sp. PGE1]
MSEMPSPVLSAAEFQRRLLAWFDVHGRHDLPWQQERTPYRVWVSEIMLQQTQVATVIPYFERFMARFPTVRELAVAHQDEVLHLWTGLGYYARGRNLHKAAGVLLDEHGGDFPMDTEALAALPGIGRSTAGAIIAQSSGERAVILDGNVKRSLARLHAVEGWPGRPAVERRLWALAEHYTPHERLVDYTQAVMDLGATLCRRGTPECGRCPFADVCLAHARGEERRFPESKPKKSLPTRTTRMLLLRDARGRVLLEQRPASGLWGGLWSLPQFDDEAALTAWLDSHAPGSAIESAGAPFLHVFSHFRLEITPQPARVERLDAVGETRRWYDPENPDAVGLAAPVKSLLTSLAPFALDAPPGPYTHEEIDP